MKATLGRAAEVQSAAKARENDSAPGVQPEAPSRAARSYRKVRNGNTLMNHSATTATAPSTPPGQCVRLVIEAEVFQDSDGGPDSLIVTTDQLACEPVSPARLRKMVEAGRAELDRIERLALMHEAQNTLRTIVAEHHLAIEEWDPATLSETFRDRFIAFTALLSDGSRVVVVPQGQDPVLRLGSVVELLRETGLAA